jgi:3-hydroxyisobutyrate dehydrogenase
MAKIAWYGTGMMGAGFVEALRRRNDEVVVWNRTFEKAKALERFGAVAIADPRAAAQGADQIHIMLSDDASVDALLDALDGAIGKDTVVVDHTTVAPAPTIARFARCAERGVAFVHAPVFMTPQAARESTAGVMLASAPKPSFDRVERTLEQMTGHLWYLGERPDKAAAMKLFGNEMLFFVVAGLADIYALARASGVEPAEAHELFSHFTPMATILQRGKKMAEGDFAPAFELTMARKDARLMIETAAAAHVPLHVLPAIAERFDELIAAGHGAEDLGVLALETAPAHSQAT